MSHKRHGDSITNHWQLDCFVKGLQDYNKQNSSGFHKENPQVTNGFPSWRASNMESVCISWQEDGWRSEQIVVQIDILIFDQVPEPYNFHTHMAM